MDYTRIIEFLLRMPIVLIALTVHEYAHGYAAYKMGDHTAKNFGRLTLNPLKHLDPIGAVCMVLCGFGWAKPVPINARNFKNPKWGMAISAAAGPLSNLIMSFFGYLSAQLVFCGLLPAVATLGNDFLYRIVLLLWIFLYAFFQLNAALAVFNLVPIPPLDGSRLLVFLPHKWYFKIMEYERYIMLGLLAVLFALSFTDFNPIGTVVGWIEAGYAFVTFPLIKLLGMI